MERANKRLRFLDEQLGPTLLKVIGATRRLFRWIVAGFQPAKPPKTEQIKCIGLLKMAAIGDTVLVSGTVADIKKYNPKIRIVLFVGASNEGYAHLIPQVDKVIRLPLKNPFLCFRLLRSEPLDVLFNFDSWPRISAIFAAVADSKWTLGFYTPGQYRHTADDQLVPHLSTRHEIENYREQLRAVGIPAGHPPLPPKFTMPEPKKRNLIIFHLWPGGTRAHLKEWPLDRWKELLERLSKETDCDFSLTGAENQRRLNQALLDTLSENLRKRVINSAGMKMHDSLRLVASAKMVVSVDTGIMHVAAALGIPTVSLHGPTSPERWGGLGPLVFAVRSPAPGAGTLHLGFDHLSAENFMEAISIDQVYQACVKALSI